MERILYNDWEITLKIINRSARSADLTKELKSTLRVGAGTTFAEIEKFRKGFNRVIRAAMKALNDGVFYSCSLVRFTPVENDAGEYVSGEFKYWTLNVSHLAANEIVFNGNCAADIVALDAKNPYKDFAANF